MLDEDLTVCRRCRHRGTACSYADTRAARHTQKPQLLSLGAERSSLREVGPQVQSRFDERSSSTDQKRVPSLDDSNHLNFADILLVCPISADDISNRWLNSYIPDDQQKPKIYPANVTTFISRMLNAYVGVLVRGRGIPPFIHDLQVNSVLSAPLATCLSVVRMCETVLPAGQTACTDVLCREMYNVYEWRGTFDNTTMLAAFQAYLIYALVLFFRLDHESDKLLQESMMKLQEIACMSARQGLVCAEEQRSARPGFESWVVAEAKRRTLYTMYLFDSVLLVKDGLPTFMATEVRGLLAPGPKSVWTAIARQQWIHEYNQYLADWPSGCLTIDELWPIPFDFGSQAIAARKRRVDQWLESVDDYGTMMYAVTSCTHGG